MIAALRSRIRSKRFGNRSHRGRGCTRIENRQMFPDEVVPLGSDPAVIRTGRIGHRRRLSRHHQRALRCEHVQQRSNDHDGSADGISDFPQGGVDHHGLLWPQAEGRQVRHERVERLGPQYRLTLRQARAARGRNSPTARRSRRDIAALTAWTVIPSTSAMSSTEQLASRASATASRSSSAIAASSGHGSTRTASSTASWIRWLRSSDPGARTADASTRWATASAISFPRKRQPRPRRRARRARGARE